MAAGRFWLGGMISFISNLILRVVGLRGRIRWERKGAVLYTTGPGLKVRDLKNDPPGLFERSDDYSSCVYFYLDRPVNNLPELAPVEQRVAGLEK